MVRSKCRRSVSTITIDQRGGQQRVLRVLKCGSSIDIGLTSNFFELVTNTLDNSTLGRFVMPLAVNTNVGPLMVIISNRCSIQHRHSQFCQTITLTSAPPQITV
jgi:hypothetical protein